MKAYLMYRDRDFDLERELPPSAADLTQDLELETLFDAMALGDKFLLDVSRRAVLASLTDPREIEYRQQVLRDCMEQEPIVRQIYAVVLEAIEGERKIYPSLFQYPEAVLHRSIEVLELFVGQLKRLRALADQHAPAFRSDGFTALFRMLQRELSDDYFLEVERHLKQLQFRHGVLVSARLGRGNKGTDYTLRKPRATRRSWRDWLALGEDSAYTLVIADRDESGMRALSELRGRGIDLAADALAQAADHIHSFFTMLRAELGFYVGCLNLWHRLADDGEPICFPTVVPASQVDLSCRGVYDVCLSLRLGGDVVGNDVAGAGKRLVMITGANRGGKSTFLRSVGLAQLMMQCGMFVGAEAFRANVCDALFTHFRREEDPGMTRGKFDEELSRMSAIVPHLGPASMVLFNESFSATNEREGAEIATGIVSALLERGIKVLYVTHSFELAHGFARQARADALFLRAERLPSGQRTFRLIEGEPLPTSYGEDLYRRIFEGAARRRDAATTTAGERTAPGSAAR